MSKKVEITSATIKSKPTSLSEESVDTSAVKITSQQAVNLQLIRLLYRYKALRFIVFFASLSFLWACITTVMMFVSFSRPEVPARVIAIDHTGRVVPLQPLTVIQQKAVVMGSKLASQIEDIMSFDYVNYRDQINKTGGMYMSSSGLTSLGRELNKNMGIIKFAIANKAIIKATVVGVPELEWQGSVNGRAARRFKFLMILNFKGPTGSLTQTYSVEAVAVRASRTLYKDGFMIHQIKMIKQGAR